MVPRKCKRSVLCGVQVLLHSSSSAAVKCKKSNLPVVYRVQRYSSSSKKRKYCCRVYLKCIVCIPVVTAPRTKGKPCSVLLLLLLSEVMSGFYGMIRTLVYVVAEQNADTTGNLSSVLRTGGVDSCKLSIYDIQNIFPRMFVIFSCCDAVRPNRVFACRI